MVLFFKVTENQIIAVNTNSQLPQADISKLSWLFSDAQLCESDPIPGKFVGPRKEMITPWSTNAVEICENIGIQGIERIEQYLRERDDSVFDPMLNRKYTNLDQSVFSIDKSPDPIISIDDIPSYNENEGLALSPEEIQYLEDLSKKIGRKLTDSEVFGFSQVNSEHCRHKIFNGIFIIDGEERHSSLFQMIKKTSSSNPNQIVSAYKDNCSFVAGPVIEQFAPHRQDIAGTFEIKEIESVLSLKAETHNFPTTVEPFNGGATGTGGEIRDRMAGGKGAIPMAGTSVYMTSYPRLNDKRSWEKRTTERKWLYQSPEEILMKASNGASDFGNKFGQALICGSLLTFEHFENGKKYGYDKVIMMAGGIGQGNLKNSEKDIPEKGDLIVVMGGDNYRIGMGGGAVSSVDTGKFENAIELNAVQRSNPEMQKRVYNTIRAMAEAGVNSIISIHDHGAGGHLNCLSELVELTGGLIDITKLPIGDPTLSAKEIVGNESQERMGLIIKKADLPLLQKIADRERAPLYVVGEVTGNHRFTFENSKTGEKPIDLELIDMFGSPPRVVLKDERIKSSFSAIEYDTSKFIEYLDDLLHLESVACKDWLTNKVDRSVSGVIAKQQTTGEIQLPLNNLGAIALDFRGTKGYATSVGHAPLAGLIDPSAGSVLSIAEALLNIIWAPLSNNLKSVSLSANWMWPCKNPGEDARLYEAVRAASEFAIDLGINIPTGKDSLSMTQKYENEVVYAPGTVIISAAAPTENVKKIINPTMIVDPNTWFIYIDFSQDNKKLGGSSFAQILGKIGDEAPTIRDTNYFARAFDAVQKLIHEGKIMSGHDISAGGMITCLLEMNFANANGGMEIDISDIDARSGFKTLFAENPGIIIQVKDRKFLNILNEKDIDYDIIGRPQINRILKIKTSTQTYELDIDLYREKWFETSYLFDAKQCGEYHAQKRFTNIKKQPLGFDFHNFTGKFTSYGIDPERNSQSNIRAAIIREKGVNGDREMAYAMHLAGMDVKDIHMTDLISGRENLEDLNMIVFVGGSTNSNVPTPAKGWAGAFKYNEKAILALENFYKRDDTLSLGVCNGCQLMVELGLIFQGNQNPAKMGPNTSGKFESAFLNVEVLPNESVMLKSLSGYRLGLWLSHGEGRFNLPLEEKNYHIPLKFSYSEYPGNPNGSDYAAAAICSEDGRHLAMMTHPERAILPWQWPFYPSGREDDEITPWIEAFVNARDWIKKSVKD